MDWLEPWFSASAFAERFALTWEKRLAIEVPAGHVLYGLPTKLLARGNGDDALFELMDGTGRVAHVHLTWSKSVERLPCPGTAVYGSLEEWATRVMVPEHEEWSS
jgi:hypothetical protein